MKRLLLATTMLLALASGANADATLGGLAWTGNGTLLTLTPVVPGGNQPTNIVCIICGANQPQQPATFGYTNFGNQGNLNDALFFSTNVSGGADPGLDTLGIPYDGTFLRNYLLANGDGTLNFSVGVDVNDTNTAQVLESFYLLNFTQRTILAAFSPGPGGTAVPSQNNGTGFPDYTLSGFNIAVGSDINIGDQLIFFARISGANDGPDSFFLVPNPVPGPVVGALLPSLVAGVGLLGFSWLRRRRNAVA